jgi:AbrB family looped-hinge helix DNA binding protein
VSRFIIEGKNRKPVSRETDSEARTLTIDSKGRISIPADIRRSLGLGSGSRVILDFDLEKNVIMLFGGSWSYGQDGVSTSTRGCESLRPGGSPGSGPKKSEVGEWKG